MLKGFRVAGFRVQGFVFQGSRVFWGVELQKSMGKRSESRVKMHTRETFTIGLVFRVQGLGRIRKVPGCITL